MEIPQSLAIESFSQSWLTSLNSSLHGLGESLRPSLDHHTPFNFPISQSSDDVHLVHADQLFSDGLIRPFFNSSTPINPIQATPSASFTSRSSNIVPTIEIHCSFFRRWRKPSVQIFVRCFKCLIRPFRLQLQVRRSIKGSSRVDDIDRRALQYSRADHCYDLVTDNSIDEAVLHCKRSILNK
ncbi:hypothetical protein HS088_TW17G00626 [Tripterygium wilfordii]|uniref:Membrane-associated kinase regulator 6 n=1 Tax=Tripterygium wilfordii TaxID=458696 RepID=A0A7J7CGB7_TRIWF|nr:uncharacterized protein LOC119983098 [Tripterygium wilfordii]KAF5733090.1 hypothetical protein HS088_TW17G00626 [Tripterygium wilfordii]